MDDQRHHCLCSPELARLLAAEPIKIQSLRSYYSYLLLMQGIRKGRGTEILGRLQPTKDVGVRNVRYQSFEVGGSGGCRVSNLQANEEAQSSLSVRFSSHVATPDKSSASPWKVDPITTSNPTYSERSISRRNLHRSIRQQNERPPSRTAQASIVSPRVHSVTTTIPIQGMRAIPISHRQAHARQTAEFPLSPSAKHNRARESVATSNPIDSMTATTISRRKAHIHAPAASSISSTDQPEELSVSQDHITSSKSLHSPLLSAQNHRPADPRRSRSRGQPQPPQPRTRSVQSATRFSSAQSCDYAEHPSSSNPAPSSRSYDGYPTSSTFVLTDTQEGNIIDNLASEILTTAGTDVQDRKRDDVRDSKIDRRSRHRCMAIPDRRRGARDSSSADGIVYQARNNNPGGKSAPVTPRSRRLDGTWSRSLFSPRKFAGGAPQRGEMGETIRAEDMWSARRDNGVVHAVDQGPWIGTWHRESFNVIANERHKERLQALSFVDTEALLINLRNAKSARVGEQD
ncbi:hypothetical protein AAMO2058_001290200 [Amorphochlora amoebiformis]